MKKEYDFSKGKLSGPVVNPKETKLKTSIRLDLDLVMWLQKQAHSESVPYQTLVNKYLREIMSKPALEERVAAIEKKLKKKAA
jgi:uncharacterized protein (DUF4415 family)